MTLFGPRIKTGSTYAHLLRVSFENLVILRGVNVGEGMALASEI